MTYDISADEFYRLRDDRTTQIAGEVDYHKLQVRLVADKGTVHSFNGQVQFLVAANLLARWCRQVEYGFPDAQLAPLLQRGTHLCLHDRIKAEVSAADPFGDFRFRQHPSASVEYTLQVGSGFVGEDVDFVVDADGWQAYGGRNSFGVEYTQSNPATAVFAACMGVADAFKVAVGHPVERRIQREVFSLLNLSIEEHTSDALVPSAPLNLGNMQIVGIGSVGSAVVYLIRMLPVVGKVLLLDLDTVEYVNLNRSPLFGVSDVGKRKVDVAAEYLQDSLSVHTFHGLYNEYINQEGRTSGQVDLLLPLANEYGIRSTIEHNFPPLQIYGTTTSSWGINYHRHIPSQQDCSLCRFPPNETALLACSEAPVEVSEGKQVDAALPFLSMAAAALTVADLLKLQLPGYPFSANFSYIDFSGGLFVNTYDRHSRPECICQSRSRPIHREFIGSTLFSAL